MAKCIQNVIVRDGIIPECPRLNRELEAKKCIQYCKFCRGYLLSISFRSAYPDRTKTREIYNVVCDFPHLNELRTRAREAVTCGGEK